MFKMWVLFLKSLGDVSPITLDVVLHNVHFDLCKF